METKERQYRIVYAAAILVAAILASPLIALYFGWAASLIWLWLVVPLGAPAYSAAQLGGLAYVVAIFFPAIRQKGGWDLVAHIGLMPPLLVITAWLFRWWFL